MMYKYLNQTTRSLEIAVWAGTFNPISRPVFHFDFTPSMRRYCFNKNTFFIWITTTVKSK